MELKKKGFKIPNSFTVLFLIIVVMAILTWIIPAGSYETVDGNIVSGTYKSVDQAQQGIWDVLRAPFMGMIGNEITSGALEVSLFILVVGGFLSVVSYTGAINAGIGAAIRKNKDNMIRLIWILMFIFGLGGSTYGMAEETMPFFAILLPMMVTVGYDPMVAMATVMVGSGVGVLSSTVNPFATGIASDMANIGIADGIFLRVLFFIVTYLLGAWYVTSYAKKVQKDPTKSLVYEEMQEKKESYHFDAQVEEITHKQKVVLWLFVLTFVVMIMGLIPWGGFKIYLFQDIHTWITNLPYVGKILGTTLIPFGDWYLVEITVWFFLMSIIIAWYYKINEAEYVKLFLEGTKELISVALICCVARGIQVVMNDGMITATILHWGEQSLAGLPNVVFSTLTYLFYIPMSFLIPSTSGLAAATMGIMAPLGHFSGVGADVVITAYQAASGIVNLITPTSGVVMGGLAICGISIAKWWKFMFKLIIMIMIASIILLSIFSMIA